MEPECLRYRKPSILTSGQPGCLEYGSTVGRHKLVRRLALPEAPEWWGLEIYALIFPVGYIWALKGLHGLRPHCSTVEQRKCVALGIRRFRKDSGKSSPLNSTIMCCFIRVPGSHLLGALPMPFIRLY